MKGIIFNITEDFIINTYGDHHLKRILDESDLLTTDPFVAPGTYPDEDLFEIVTKASRYLNVGTDRLLNDLGTYAFSQLAARYSNFMKGQNSAKEFLKTIESVVHVEVQKLYTDAYLPSFLYKDTSPNELTITYYSKRKLYSLMEGLIDGVGNHFKTKIHRERKIYEKDGREYCDFYLEFLPN